MCNGTNCDATTSMRLETGKAPRWPSTLRPPQATYKTHDCKDGRARLEDDVLESKRERESETQAGLATLGSQLVQASTSKTRDCKDGRACIDVLCRHRYGPV